MSSSAPPPLRPYQRALVDFVRRTRGAALYLPPGAGKTAITLSAITPEYLPVLVVAPPRVAENTWPTECALWRPDLSCSAAVGSPAKRRAVLDSDADVISLSWESLGDLTAADQKRFQLVVFDEAHYAKTPKSKRFKLAKRFLTDHRKTLVLTGSPGQPLDWWALTYLLDRGDRLGKTITAYRSRYFVAGRQLPTGVVVEYLPREGAVDSIQRKIADVSASFDSAAFIEGLPEKLDNVVEVELPSRAAKVYEQFRRDLVADLRLIDDDPAASVHSAANAAVLSSKLSQVAAGGVYADRDSEDAGTVTHLHDAKLEALREIVEGTDDNVLVTFRFRFERAAVLRAFPEAATTETPDFVRRWNAGEFKVLVAHPASIGVGLNLQGGGATLVWTSPTWSATEREQLEARLHRSGQTRTVWVHHLVVPGSVDTAAMKAVEGKLSAQAAFLEAVRL